MVELSKAYIRELTTMLEGEHSGGEKVLCHCPFCGGKLLRFMRGITYYSMEHEHYIANTPSLPLKDYSGVTCTTCGVGLAAQPNALSPIPLERMVSLEQIPSPLEALHLLLREELPEYARHFLSLVGEHRTAP